MIWYIVGGILLCVIGFICYVMYKGYSKIKPDPLQGVPVPPFSHPLLGHPDKMLSPLKHELRLEVTESFKGPYHQLVMMKHASIFVNDAVEIASLFLSLPTKGAMYEIFRYNKPIPDMLASDGEAYNIRSSHLRESMMNATITENDLSKILDQLDDKLKSYAESGKSVNLIEILTLLSLDVVSRTFFGYELNALEGSNEGAKLFTCLSTLTEYQAGQGLYADPKVRKVSKEEIADVTSNWRMYLTKMVKKLRSDSEAFKASHGELDIKNNFGHALSQLAEDEQSFGEPEMLSEVHQVFRHGHECIAGMLTWAFFALYRHPKIRAELEKEVSSASKPSTSLLDCFIKEVFRMYPTAGNMTVRTVHEEGFKLSRGHVVPVNTPVHLTVWSSHNSTREWVKPRDFLPERWMTPYGKEGVDEKDPTFPTCPFFKKFSGYKPCDVPIEYEGVGFDEDSLCYFPFSAGPRSCPAKKFSLFVIKEVLKRVIVSHRMEPFESFWETDPGQTVNAIIIPLFKQATTVRIDRATELGKVPAKKEEGWADAEDTEQNDAPAGEEAEAPAAGDKSESEFTDSGHDFEKVEHEDSYSEKH